MVEKGSRRFGVLLTADFFGADGRPLYRDLGLGLFDQYPHIARGTFEEHRAEITPEQIGNAQGVIVLTAAVTAHSVANASDLIVIGRFGVGYDAVAVAACTEADVAVFITAGAVDHSVAEATVMWMLALGHHATIKDQLVRSGRWDERSRYMGRELRGRTLGVIGLGGIGRTLIRLLAGFGMNPPLAFDPYLDTATAQQIGVHLVALDQLLQSSDFVSVHCPLTPQTRGLLGTRELGLMRPDAYLINTARGGIVDEDALFDALQQRRIAGAAIDVFAVEPVRSPHRFGQLDNVLLAPHSIAWTDEMFHDIGRAACQGMIDISLGRRPRGVVNPEVFERPSFQRKWERLKTELPD